MANINYELLDDLTLENLLPEYADIAEAIGIEAFKALIRLCGGYQFVVPTVLTVTRDIRNQRIAEEFNGYNVKELVRKYGLTDSTIYKILKSNRKNSDNSARMEKYGKQ